MGLASVTMLVPIGACGLQVISLRLISARSLDEDRAEIEYVARKTLLLSFGSSLVLAAGFYALAPWLADNVFRKPETRRGVALVFRQRSCWAAWPRSRRITCKASANLPSL